MSYWMTSGSSARRREKRQERQEKGLCVECGQKPCNCRKFKKNRRKRIPEALRNTRIKDRHSENESYAEFQANKIGRKKK